MKKDVARDAAGPTWSARPSTPETLLRRDRRLEPSRRPRFCTGFPRRLYGRDIALKLAGAGGDGAQTAAMLITRAAINEGFDATHIPSYGPESRGGTSYADVRIAEDEVLSPAAPAAARAGGLQRAEPRQVRPRGRARRRPSIYDSSVVTEPPRLDPEVRLARRALQRRSPQDLGKIMVKNIVALGALQAAHAPLPGGDVPDRDPPGPARTSARSSPSTRQAFARGMHAGTGTAA